MSCAICKTRRARRYCPGVRGDICTVCCGEEREKTVRCPLDCKFLLEARKHERPGQFRPADLPNSDIAVTQKLLQENQSLLLFLGGVLGSAALHTPGAVDFDVRDALDALVRSYRTLVSGVVYETVPQNTVAAGICRFVHEAIGRFRMEEAKELGVSRTRDAGVLVALVYLQRLEMDCNNGRPRGRSFVGQLRRYYGIAQPEAPSSSLILP